MSAGLCDKVADCIVFHLAVEPAYRSILLVLESTVPRFRTEGCVMPLCSGGHLSSAFSIPHLHFRQSAGQTQQSLANLSRSTASRGHLIHSHSSGNVPWSRRRHIHKWRYEAWSSDHSQTEAADRSSSSNEQPSNGVGDGNASSSSPEHEPGSSVRVSESTEASASPTPSANEPEQSALEQIVERYPVLGSAFETKNAVGAGTEQPQAVLQAFLSRTDELWRIGAQSMVWTAAGLMHLVTKPILPRSAHIAQLKKGLQADPTNADK